MTKSISGEVSMLFTLLARQKLDLLFFEYFEIVFDCLPLVCPLDAEENPLTWIANAAIANTTSMDVDLNVWVMMRETTVD